MWSRREKEEILIRPYLQCFGKLRWKEEELGPKKAPIANTVGGLCPKLLINGLEEMRMDDHLTNLSPSEGRSHSVLASVVILRLRVAIHILFLLV